MYVDLLIRLSAGVRDCGRVVVVRLLCEGVGGELLSDFALLLLPLGREVGPVVRQLVILLVKGLVPYEEVHRHTVPDVQPFGHKVGAGPHLLQSLVQSRRPGRWREVRRRNVALGKAGARLRRLALPELR